VIQTATNAVRYETKWIKIVEVISKIVFVQDLRGVIKILFKTGSRSFRQNKIQCKITRDFIQVHSESSRYYSKRFKVSEKQPTRLTPSGPFSLSQSRSLRRVSKEIERCVVRRWATFAGTAIAWERLMFPRPSDLLREYIIVLRTTFLLWGLWILATVGLRPLRSGLGFQSRPIQLGLLPYCREFFIVCSSANFSDKERPFVFHQPFEAETPSK
jgi:hypothetical protein